MQHATHATAAKPRIEATPDLDDFSLVSLTLRSRTGR